MTEPPTTATDEDMPAPELDWAPRNGEMLVVFDGICTFCNRWVMFVINRDPGSKFRFVTAQTPTGEIILRRFGVDPVQGLNTILLTDGMQAWTKSEAIFNVLAMLSGPVRHLVVLRGLPRALRDWAYDQFGKRRYKLFGTLRSCPVPSREIATRFLS